MYRILFEAMFGWVAERMLYTHPQEACWDMQSYKRVIVRLRSISAQIDINKHIYVLFVQFCLH